MNSPPEPILQRKDRQVRIKILDLPELADLFGQRELSFSFSGETLKDLLQALFERYGLALERILLDSRGRWNPAVQIIVKGRLCAEAVEPVPLEDGDSLAFVVLLEGG
jgi:hypothetical protein